MSNYPDSSPVSHDGGKGGRKSERDIPVKGGAKNNDGRLRGGKWDGQDNSAEAGFPQRTASRNSKKTFDPNEDAPNLQGGTAYAGERREGLEEGAY